MAVAHTEHPPFPAPPRERPRPVVIQGGMGVAVSGWRLAREVAQAGHLGVVSGTAMDAVLSRVLQDGDPGGHYRRALAHFPSPAMAGRVLEKYFVEGGKAPDAPYKPIPKLTLETARAGQELAVLGNFAEVWLAKEDLGTDAVVGINCLEKVQMATPTALLGAMLAGVDYVLMGAGIPREIPQLLRALAAGRPGSITADVAGGSIRRTVSVDPADLLGEDLPSLVRPDFLAIVSVDQLASYLHRDPDIRPDGFVVERPPAGGHSAPPRGKLQLDEGGEPVYGSRDEADLAKMAALGLPFWMAGAYGTPEQVAEALRAGAVGVQVGTLFALSLDSGLAAGARGQLLDQLRSGELTVRNDPRASPTGFPFKVATLEGSASQTEVYEARPRLCDLSYLRQPYEREDGEVGYRCASEPVHMYLKKGGTEEETRGRKCLCNGLMANIGLGQHRKDGYVEDILVTLGQDLAGAKELIKRYAHGWRAVHALQYLQEHLPGVRLAAV
ncbi:2-nitropropane dioxygenase [Ornithinimicrobium pekingense]|uniref:2-nitropropane dioxygenase n=2 Tax=Ornithinimicrobium pekingense TaxID=384677 RepID=A0ABQ2F6W5_9MICO|nr:2-nitropropane dioxygenase [Ornithinimicrobium pekingense]GGK63940.1 2-nitropropane dioxygenase [Ornithinimicrobium pekingense]